MKAMLSQHYARLGRRGGRVRSEAKRLANRRNALRRWGRLDEAALIPLEHLRDGHWYRGQGRNNNLGRWDADAQCFWVVCFANFSNPATYPQGSVRVVRLKQEQHFTAAGGTFKPWARI